MEREKFNALLEKYRLGTLTPEEQAKLEAWYVRYAAESPLKADPEIMRERLDQIASNLPLHRRPQKLRRMTPYLSGAALLIIGFGLFFWIQKGEGGRNANLTAIHPGYNQATLTLADGRTISLDSAQGEIIMEDEGVVYSNGKKVGEAGYAEPDAVSNAQTNPDTPYAILTTPKGGQYRIVLSDGTKIMLNASSTLRYPTRFTGAFRTVEISGEGFFEVVQAKDQPFVVKCKQLEINVIGTSFNVSSYPDEERERVAIITGRVKVGAVGLDRETHDVQLLTPGKQATLQDSRLMVNTIDVDTEIAWTKGYFAFNTCTLEDVLKQLSRWYSIDEVSYSEQALKKELFSGTISRYDQISQVLHKLALTGTVAFRTEGQTIQVIRGDISP